MPVEVGVGYVSIVPSLRGFETELRRQLVPPMDDSGEQAGARFSDRLKGSVATGALAAGALAGAALAKGFTNAVAQDKATAKLGAQLGISGKESARLGKISGAVYAKGYGESFDQVNEAIKGLASNGVASVKAPKKEIAGLSKAALSLAETFDADVADSTRAAGQLIRTGLAKDGKAAFDLITKGFGTSADKGGDFLDTLNEYSTQFAKIGLTGKQSLGIINQAIEGGARDSDQVADALKEFSLRAVDGSDATSAAFKTLGIDAGSFVKQFSKGGKSGQKALDLVFDKLRTLKGDEWQNTVAALFGGPGEDLGKAINKIDVSKAASEIGRVDGASKKLGDSLHNNASARIEEFKRTAEQGLTNFVGGKLLPAVETIAPVVATALGPVKELFGWIAADPARIQAATTGVLGLAAAYGTLKTVSAARSGIASARDGFATLRDNAGRASQRIKDAAFAVKYYTVTGAQSAKQALVTGGRWAAGAARASGAWVAARGRAVVSFVQTAASATVNAGRTALTWTGAALRSAARWGVMRARAAGAFVGTAASAVVNAGRTAVTWTVAAVRTGMGWAAARARAVGAFAAIALSATVNAGRTAIAWVGAQTRSALATGRATAALAAQRIGMVATAVATRAMAAGQWILNAAMRANPIGLIITGLVALGAGLVLAYKKSATFRGIVQGAMRGVMVAVRAVGAAGMWLWKNAIGPALRGVGTAVKWLYTGVVKPYFNLWKLGFRALGAVGRWLYEKAIRPAWRALGAVIKSVYSSTVKPILDKGRAAVRVFALGFRTAKDSIGKQWSKLRSITKKPVQFVIDTVYNNGIRALWNKVSSAFGGPTLKRMAFKSGGILPGHTPGRDVHQFVSPTGGRLALSGGEAIMRPEWTRAIGARGVAAMNAIARRRGARGVQEAMSGGQQQGFKDGGIFGWIGDAGTALKGVGSKAWDAVKKGASWLKDGLEASARAGVKHLVNPLLSKIPGLDTGWGKQIKNIPDKVLDTIFGYAKKADGKMEAQYSSAAVGGSGVKRWTKVVLQALKMVGQPASLLNTVLRRMNQESGGNPRAINNWDINAKNGDPSRGLMQTIGATFNAYAGKLRSRGIYDPLANVYASMRYALSRYGSLAKAYNRPGGYAAGGRPRAGELAWTGEEGPELVRFRGGEEVYDHRTSMRMAAGIGARGFAKGTSKAARGQIPGDLKAWTKALTGSASDISKAAKELAKDLKAAGGSGSRLAKATDSTAKKLGKLAEQRDKVAEAIEKANEYIKEQKSAASEYIGISQLGEATSVGDVLSGLTERQDTTRSFQDSIAKLKKAGLNSDYLGQLIGMGPESELAGILAGASKGQISALNQLAKSGAKLSSSYGSAMGDYLYDAGSKAGSGILAGLKAQEKELQKQMDKLGKRLASSVKKSLGIKSPSRVMRDEVGVPMGAGLIQGIADTIPQIESQAERMAAAAVPASSVVPVSASASAPQSAGAGLDGRPLYLVVEDGTVLRAYVDDRVDQGLSDVRSRARAGAKR